MTDKNHEQDDMRLRSENDALDGELNAALARYADVEPREGLEKRILAHLQTERTQVPERLWWRWPIVAAVAAVVFIAITLTLRSGSPAAPQIVLRPAPQRQSAKQSPPVVAQDDGGVRNMMNPTRKASVHHSQVMSATTAPLNPKLDVFPSPQPLSEQEKILAAYVAQFHEQAVVIARVTESELEQDRKEVLGPPQDLVGSADSGRQQTRN